MKVQPRPKGKQGTVHKKTTAMAAADQPHRRSYQVAHGSGSFAERIQARIARARARFIKRATGEPGIWTGLSGYAMRERKAGRTRGLRDYARERGIALDGD